ncbi:MAG: hypothetical protein GY868_21265 [Deltaproteobacteria bacterium]|nr:hypothetical protein [Deltaproteobacteria bacterium]
MQTDNTELDDRNPELLDAIRQRAVGKIAGLKKSAAQEVRSFHERQVAALCAFKSKSDAEAAAKIKQQIGRIRNRSLIEKKKLALCLQDEFIRSMVQEVICELHGKFSERYLRYLRDGITAALHEIPNGRARVLVAERDLAQMDKLQKQSDWPHTISFVADDVLAEGGAVVIDPVKGLRYNVSIERHLRRSYDQIRKAAKELLKPE